MLEMDGQAEKAVEILREGLDALPDSRKIGRRVAGALLSSGKGTEAAKLLAGQWGTSSEDWRVQVELASVAQRNNLWSEVVRFALHALEQLPPGSNDEARGDVAAILLYVPGERHSALRIVTETAEASESAVPWVFLSVLHEQEGNDQEARACWENALRRWPGSEASLASSRDQVRASIPSPGI